MSDHFIQQGGGEPTSPTPYPDGLIIHHVDGTITYPDAYTGERVVQWGDEWYQSLGFFEESPFGSSDWGWYGFRLFDNWFTGELLMFASWLVLLTWLALPFLPGLNPRGFRAYLAWAGCVTLTTAALALLFADNTWDEELEFVLTAAPAGLLFWWSSSTAKNLRARAWRVGLAAVLLLFPWLPLGILVSGWHREEAIWRSACFAVMLPLALSRRTELLQGAQRWMVAAVPILIFFASLLLGHSDRIVSPWASHAIPMAIAAFLLLRPRTTLARPAVA